MLPSGSRPVRRPSVLPASVLAACDRVGAWLHADEVYHGTELDGEPTRSFRGMYDKLIVTNSLSKAYGLAGLRIGWAVAAPDVADADARLEVGPAGGDHVYWRAHLVVWPRGRRCRRHARR